MDNRQQKLDLLAGCNDQHLPPREFMGIFCKRCRNAACVNAGWSGGLWVDRMATQVDRLLVNPNFADPRDSKFDPLRELNFREISEALVLRTKADPWGGPEVHLADPTEGTSANRSVEDAVRALSASRMGAAPPALIEAAPPPTPAPVVPEPPPARRNPSYFLDEAAPEPVKPAAPAKPAPTPPDAHAVNTPFPEEGVMIGGPPTTPMRSGPAVDEWAPPVADPSKKALKVAVGARVKMTGENQ
jgi:hypothetical protein